MRSQHTLIVLHCVLMVHLNRALNAFIQQYFCHLSLNFFFNFFSSIFFIEFLGWIRKNNESSNPKINRKLQRPLFINRYWNREKCLCHFFLCVSESINNLSFNCCGVICCSVYSPYNAAGQ